MWIMLARSFLLGVLEESYFVHALFFHLDSLVDIRMVILNFSELAHRFLLPWGWILVVSVVLSLPHFS